MTTTDSTLIATHADAKALGYCNSGLRQWFPRDGVSFDEFRRQGVSTVWLRQSGDAMAIRLAEFVEGREGS